MRIFPLSQKMKVNKALYFVFSLAAFVACNNNPSDGEIIVNVNEKGASIASSMYGIFFEEINSAGDGGLYGELIKNRSFEELEMPEGYRAEGDRLIPNQVLNHQTHRVEQQTFKWTTDPVPGWSMDAEPSIAAMKLSKEKPCFEMAPNNLKVTIKDASKPVELHNSGFWGINAVDGETYHLRAIIRPSANYSGSVVVKLISQTNEVISIVDLGALKADSWNDIKKDLIAKGSDHKARLSLSFNSTGTVWIDYVSLFPENTFNNRSNGLRKDVAETLTGLRPAFVRWPGGCVVEGISLENRFEWKKTLGDPAARSGEYSLWGYNNTYGFGYYEFLQFCEDINAEGMYVCNVGLGCQYRMGDACSNNEVYYYLDDCLDAIEYAIGDVNTEWGAKRAAAGHPEAFPLKYVEIGNENRGELYEERFDIFYAAIKEKYPELILISNHGIEGTGNIKETDMVDPHYYVAPDFFFGNTTLFDNLERGKYKVYVGEYAVNSGVGLGNMTAALSEAAYITGMERNGDLVTMTSYAPLLENRNNHCWAVNLIWLNSHQVMGRSSYYVQKMTAENMPDYNVGLSKTKAESRPQPIPDGKVGFGTWATQTEFRDFKITLDNKTIEPDINDVAIKSGEWEVKDEILAQTSMQQGSRWILNGFDGNDYTMEFKARKIEGNEGFFVFFGINNNKNGLAFNIGGWGNTRAAVQNVLNGSTASQLGTQVNYSMESGKWYSVKLVVNKEKAEIFMDDKSILSYEHSINPLQFYAAGYDEENSELILKVVNADSITYHPKLTLNGVENVNKKGKVITLSAESGDVENSFEEPRKIYPKETEFTGFNNSFNYAFSPYSYTILRIKAKQISSE